MLAAWGVTPPAGALGGKRNKSDLVALCDDVLFVFGRGRGCGYDGVALDLGKLLLIRVRIKEFMARVTSGIEPEHHGLRLHCASRGEGDGRVTNGGVRTASVYGEDRRIEHGSVRVEYLNYVACIVGVRQDEPVGSGRQNASRNLDGLIEGELGSLIVLGGPCSRQHERGCER